MLVAKWLSVALLLGQFVLAAESTEPPNGLALERVWRIVAERDPATAQAPLPEDRREEITPFSLRSG